MQTHNGASLVVCGLPEITYVRLSNYRNDQKQTIETIVTNRNESRDGIEANQPESNPIQSNPIHLSN
jgi:hypothetical protein